MELDKTYYVYIMTNKHHTVLYIGKSGYLDDRVRGHKEKVDKKSFTSRYNINKLVFFESFPSDEEADFRERQIKAGSRQKKINLINAMNPEWRDLSEDFKEF